MADLIYTTQHKPLDIGTLTLDEEGNFSREFPEMWLQTHRGSRGEFEVTLKGFNYAIRKEKAKGEDKKRLNQKREPERRRLGQETEKAEKEELNRKKESRIIHLSMYPFTILEYVYPTPENGIALTSGEVPTTNEEKTEILLNFIEAQMGESEVKLRFPYATQEQYSLIEEFLNEKVLPLNGYPSGFPSQLYDTMVMDIKRYCGHSAPFQKGNLGIDAHFKDCFQGLVQDIMIDSP